MVCPKYAWQVFYPLSFGLFLSCLQISQDRPIGDLDLFICFRMARRGEMIGDGETCAKLSEFIIVEFPGIVRDNNLRNPKLADDALPHEIHGISFCDPRKRFSFYPLCEVVNGDN